MCKLFLILFSSVLIYLAACEDDARLEITLNTASKSKGSAHNSIVQKRVEDTLNLTCRVVSTLNEALPKYRVTWHVPVMAQNREHRVTRLPGPNLLGLVVQNLQETDTGEYSCEAFKEHRDLSAEEEDEDGESVLKQTVRINVKSKKPQCNENFLFQCTPGICIARRYLCDGVPDCSNQLDESAELCGEDACARKLKCEDHRCIPYNWCCDLYHQTLSPNCTSKLDDIPCCRHFAKVNSPYEEPQQSVFTVQVNQLDLNHQKFSDMGFLQTTIYAVVGSAMAFMFVVTILIVAICRIHLRRHAALTARCTAARVYTRHPMQQHLYDLDLLNRPYPTSDLLVPQPDILVTYNINNGVQFVGRPVNPPPYSEVVSLPPREGPPPAYVSRENLARTEEGGEGEEGEESEGEREGEGVTTPLRSEESNDHIA